MRIKFMKFEIIKTLVLCIFQALLSHFFFTSKYSVCHWHMIDEFNFECKRVLFFLLCIRQKVWIEIYVRLRRTATNALFLDLNNKNKQQHNIRNMYLKYVYF